MIAHNKAVKDGDISAFDKNMYVLRFANRVDADYDLSVYEKLAYSVYQSFQRRKV